MKRTFVGLLAVMTLAVAACNSESAPTSPQLVASPVALVSAGTCTLANGNTASTGFDQYGYNRCAHQFVGTFAGYCAARSASSDCGGVTGTTRLVMKWNEEWDRGNATGWANGPYTANLDNEINGSLLDGTSFSEHFMTTWDAGCVSSGGTSATNGGSCIWGAFRILIDQGMQGGAKMWWTRATPAGYGS